MKDRPKSLLQRFSNTVSLLIRFAAFASGLLCYFLIMGQKIWPLLEFTRTSGIVLLAYVLTYIFMTKVYGGFDIGVRKSKPIIYTMIITLLFTDISANIFLSVMVSTDAHDRTFVFESPLLLLLVYAVQMILTVLLTYLGNAAYFRLNPAADCLVVTKDGADVKDFLKAIGGYHKQFKNIHVTDRQDPGLMDKIYACDAVFFYGLTPEERNEGVLFAYRKKKDIYYSLELPDIVGLRGKVANYGDKSFIASPEIYMTFEQRCIKRAMDLFISGLALILLSPLFLITAIAIKLEDRGPVFYKQQRATFGGRPFNVLKFRSMRVADGDIHVSVTKDDDRITKVGRIIRKYRIDELPQLINILKSDMSLVGPRPEMLENVEKYTAELPEFVYRLRAKAGLTGLAQIYGRYNTTPKDKLMLDLSYIEQFNIWLDLKLLFRTVLVLFTPDSSTEAFENTEDGAEHE